MNGIDRRLINNFNWLLFIVAILITAIGIATIYSANYNPSNTSHISFIHVKKQLLWLFISFLSMLVFISFDYKKLESYVFPLYIINLGLLIAVLIIGRTSMGAQRWLSIGGFNLQPSELFKFTTIFVVAKFFSNEGKIKEFSIIELLKLS